MKHAQIIKHFGSPTKASRAIGVSLQTLRNWKIAIPYKTQRWLEFETGGKLKAARK